MRTAMLTAKRNFVTLAGCFLVISLITAGYAKEKFSWNMQSLWQAGSINHKLFEQFCKDIEKLTGGRLQINPVPVGTFVAYNETLDAVGSGIIDGQQSGPGYFAGKDPAFAMLAEFPGGYETAYQMQMWFEYGGGKALAREVYARFNIFYIGSIWHGMESIPSKKPIRSTADLKGLKLRIPEGLNQVIFKELGAVPVNIPGSEVYTALDRGVIDATDWGTLSMNVDLGYHKIAPYQTHPGFHSLAMSDVAVNMERWNELPDDLRSIVEMAVRDFARAVIQEIELNDIAVAERISADGVELIDWDEEQRRQFRKVAAEVLRDFTSGKPLARRIYQSHVDFLKKLHLYE
jgi:TRAP-type mannitol/chloroaromatic compound transport system substrate-binding protein